MQKVVIIIIFLCLLGARPLVINNSSLGPFQWYCVWLIFIHRVKTDESHEQKGIYYKCSSVDRVG